MNNYLGILALTASFVFTAAHTSRSDEPVRVQPSDRAEIANDRAVSAAGEFTAPSEEAVEQAAISVESNLEAGTTTTGEIPDNSLVEGAEREASYSNPELDKAVAKALSDQGYFAAGVDGTKEAFIAAVKNFQTLNNMKPTGEVTAELAGKLGVGGDQFSPE